jgi:endonuclease G
MPGAHPVPLEEARAADTVKADRTKSTFMEDADVPEMFRAKLNDC